MSDFLTQEPIILASASSIRKKLLSTLGIGFQTIPSGCDEDALKKRFQDSDLIQLGYLLAAEKALEISRRYPEQFIIGADQLCIQDQVLFDKPLNHPTAVEHLKRLQGKSHQQIACLCIAKNETIIWQHHETASLNMRPLSEATIEAYLQAEKPYHSCGAYQYETLGKWLFEEIIGKEETILGLPLHALAEAMLSLNIVRF